MLFPHTKPVCPLHSRGQGTFQIYHVLIPPSKGDLQAPENQQDLLVPRHVLINSIMLSSFPFFLALLRDNQ